MIAKRYESVWDALEDTPGAAENMKIRSVLMQELVAHISDAGMTQSEAAKQFNVTQPEFPISCGERLTSSVSMPWSTCLRLLGFT
jgi:predicted XRE-type DNA-binding protein